MLTRACALVVALTAVAHADCPTSIREQAPAGFLAATARQLIEPGAPRESGMEGRIGVAAGMRAESNAGEAGSLGSIGADLRVRRGSLAGCVSGDVVATDTLAARATASGQVPLLFTGLSLGGTFDHGVELPLSARPELVRAPFDRVASQVSLAFVDIGLVDHGDRLRMLVMPVTIEQALTTQSLDARTRTRHSTAIETAMFRFVSTDTKGRSGELGLFGIESDWIATPGSAGGRRAPGGSAESIDSTNQMTAEAGYVRFSPVSIEGQGPRWSFELDGGVLSLAGNVDCERERCTRGDYRLALARTWSGLSLGGRLERTAFMTAQDALAIEDRAAATGTVELRTMRLATSAFVARTQAWAGGEGTPSAGAHATLARPLAHGFAAVVDGEATTAASRVLVSLGWQRSTSRH